MLFMSGALLTHAESHAISSAFSFSYENENGKRKKANKWITLCIDELKAFEKGEVGLKITLGKVIMAILKC